MKILITGSNGLIGTVLSSALGSKYRLSGLDMASSDGESPISTTLGNVANLEPAMSAFQNVNTVIHLAATLRLAAPWLDVLEHNITATHNVFEACRQCNVRRVIFASSNHVVGLFENDDPYKSIVAGEYQGISPKHIPKIDHTVSLRPDSHYGVSKVFGEAMGRYYVEQFGIEVVCLRIGSVTRHNNPTKMIRHYATWLSHRDLSQLVERCIEVPLQFEIFYGVSNNTWRFWDILHAQQVLGYEPKDNAEDWR